MTHRATEKRVFIDEALIFQRLEGSDERPSGQNDMDSHRSYNESSSYSGDVSPSAVRSKVVERLCRLQNASKLHQSKFRYSCRAHYSHG
jgi:hypothetical protein